MSVKTQKYHIHVEADDRSFGLKLKETWQYRELIWLFAKRNLVIRYKQTILGPLWLILSPLFTAIMQAVIFGTVAGIDTEGLPKILFYLASHSLWAFFSATVHRCSNTFTGYSYIFGKIYFPRLTVPFSEVLLGCLEYLIQFAVLAVMCVWFSFHGIGINYAGWLLVPFILLWLGMLGMGFGIIVSSLTAKYRDLRILVGFGVSAWMYGTPVVYPLSQLKPGLLRQIILLNPATAPTEIYRRLLFGVGSELPPWSILLSLAVTAGLLIGGAVVFNRTERTFMDTI